MQRFEMVLEPAGTFAIFDVLTGLPAQDQHRALIGLSRDEAVLALATGAMPTAGSNPLIVANRWPRPARP